MHLGNSNVTTIGKQVSVERQNQAFDRKRLTLGGRNAVPVDAALIRMRRFTCAGPMSTASEERRHLGTRRPDICTGSTELAKTFNLLDSELLLHTIEQ
jgi:hypothetical protein